MKEETKEKDAEGRGIGFERMGEASLGQQGSTLGSRWRVPQCCGVTPTRGRGLSEERDTDSPACDFGRDARERERHRYIYIYIYMTTWRSSVAVGAALTRASENCHNTQTGLGPTPPWHGTAWGRMGQGTRGAGRGGADRGRRY